MCALHASGLEAMVILDCDYSETGNRYAVEQID